eukprot:6200856-Heterocapsa_arctica.AAC.1
MRSPWLGAHVGNTVPQTIVCCKAQCRNEDVLAHGLTSCSSDWDPYGPSSKLVDKKMACPLGS